MTSMRCTKTVSRPGKASYQKSLPGADLGGGCRGCAPPPLRWPAVLWYNWYSAKTMWFIGVEVEQETSAPPPKKNPGSAPDCWYRTAWWKCVFRVSWTLNVNAWDANCLFAINVQCLKKTSCRLWYTVLRAECNARFLVLFFAINCQRKARQFARDTCLFLCFNEVQLVKKDHLRFNVC